MKFTNVVAILLVGVALAACVNDDNRQDNAVVPQTC